MIHTLGLSSDHFVTHRTVMRIDCFQSQYVWGSTIRGAKVNPLKLNLIEAIVTIFMECLVCVRPFLDTSYIFHEKPQHFYVIHIIIMPILR